MDAGAVIAELDVERHLDEVLVALRLLDEVVDREGAVWRGMILAIDEATEAAMDVVVHDPPDDLAVLQGVSLAIALTGAYGRTARVACAVPRNLGLYALDSWLDRLRSHGCWNLGLHVLGHRAARQSRCSGCWCYE